MGNRITHAYLPLEHKTLSIDEYRKYLKDNSNWLSLSQNIICPECGDTLTYAAGEIYNPYFKHSPSNKGHDYCSLYSGGYESNSCESVFRKKFFKEKDISFNYVIRYWNNYWDNYITIPSLSFEDIGKNENNHTKIQIKFGNLPKDNVMIDVDYGHFYPDKIQKLKLSKITSKLVVSISGDTGTKSIEFDGFKPTSQIYTYLLAQDYSEQNFKIGKEETFSIKRISGKIFTLRHYVIFADKSLKIEEYKENGIEVNEIIIPELKIGDWIKYQVYDIFFTNKCFNQGKTNEFVTNFCSFRNCQLIKESEALVVWPPVNSVENYKYFDIGEDIYLYSSTEQQNSLKKIHDENITFSIQNTNSSKIYITKGKGKDVISYEGKYISEKTRYINIEDIEAYSFKNGVLIEKINGRHKILNDEYIAVYIDKLNRKILQTQKRDDVDILHAIRYGNKLEKFDFDEYKNLLLKYSEDEIIKGYLELCINEGYIKSDALKVLRGNNNESI